MSRENVEAVRAAYDVAYAQRSVEGVRDKFAEDFRWHNRPEFPGRAVYLAEEMPKLWAELDDTYAEFELAPDEFMEHGDYVIVTVRLSTRLRGSDSRVEGTTWHVWRVLDGLPQEGRAYGSRREALEAVGLRE